MLYRLLALMMPLMARAVYFGKAPDPKLISPNATTVWRVGEFATIEWNASYRLTGNLYYNNRTRVNIHLYRAEGRRHELAFRIAENFPLMYGSISWSVPNLEMANDTLFFVMVYPNFFDWPGQCSGCLEKAPRSDLFPIAPCVENCVPGDGAVRFGAPPLPAGLEDQLLTRYISIGIGCVAFIGFVVAFFVYTKQGRKTWQFYRRKRIGMLYKYQPNREPTPTIQTDHSDSPLGNFFSSMDRRKRDSQEMSDGGGGGSDVSISDGEEHGESSSHATIIPQHARMPVLEMPAAPENAFAVMRPPRPYPPLKVQNDPTRKESPTLPREDAILAATTFRNVLRAGSSNGSDDHDNLSTISPTPIRAYDTKSTYGSSPVLSHLEWISNTDHFPPN